MTSSCPDAAATGLPGPAGPRVPAGPSAPSAHGRRTRLTVALLIALAALAGPAVGSTSARFTSRTETPPLRIEIPMPTPSDTASPEAPAD